MNDSSTNYHQNNPVIVPIEECIGFREEPQDKDDWRVWDRDVYEHRHLPAARLGFYQLSTQTLWVDPHTCIGEDGITLAIQERVAILMYQPGREVYPLLLVPANWIREKYPHHPKWVSLLERRFRQEHKITRKTERIWILP